MSLPAGFGSGWDNYRGEPGQTLARTARREGGPGWRGAREAFLHTIRRQPAEACRCGSCACCAGPTRCLQAGFVHNR